MKKMIVLIAICGAFLSFGVLAGFGTIRDVRLGLASREWPSVMGEVIRARRRVGRSALRRFEYRYTVNGNTYTSARAAFVRPPYIDPLYRKYRSGMAVRVYYDPGDPTRSLVEPGAPVLGVLADSFVSVMMFTLGGAGLFFGMRRRDQGGS